MPESHFGILMTLALEPMLDAAGVGEGKRVLDVAAGSSARAAAAAARRGAEITGLDISTDSVAAARRLYPLLRFEVGDAEALPFPDRSFDAVIMNYGLLHVSNPELALSEAHRVLVRGGRVAFTLWAAADKALGYGIPLRAMETRGDSTLPNPAGPSYFRFSDHDQCHRILLEAGFVRPRVREVAQTWTAPSAAAAFQQVHDGIIIGPRLRAQSRAALDAIRNAVFEEMKALEGDGQVAIPMPAVLASAHKP